MEDPHARESFPCPLCQNDSFSSEIQGVRDLIWRKPGVFELQRCKRCSLVVTRPRPTEQALSFYYEDTYSGQGEEDMRRFQTESWLSHQIARYRVKVISKIYEFAQSDSVLDVGCSYGTFCRYIRKTFGCRVTGIDLDAGAIEKAADQDLIDYRVSELDALDLPPQSLSVVTFFETLEHHRDPVGALNKAHKLLRPGGICVVEVPNYNGFWRRVFGRFWLPLLVPQHLFHFTPETLRTTFVAAGFEKVVYHQTMFYPLEGIASLGLWLSRVLRSPPPDAPVTWRTPFDVSIFFLLCILYPIIEVPSQALLRFIGLAGHQIAIAYRDETESP